MITEFEDICFICGKQASETHHLIFGRGMRPLADKDDITAPMCFECHKKLHYNGMTEAMSKVIGQLEWEKKYIVEKQMTEKEAREAFRSRYSRSYL